VTGDIADEKLLESVITEDVRRYVSHYRVRAGV